MTCKGNAIGCHNSHDIVRKSFIFSKSYLQVYVEDDAEVKFLNEAKLSEAIRKSQHQLSILLQPAKELKEKYR